MPQPAGHHHPPLARVTIQFVPTILLLGRQNRIPNLIQLATPEKWENQNFRVELRTIWPMEPGVQPSGRNGTMLIVARVRPHQFELLQMFVIKEWWPHTLRD